MHRRIPHSRAIADGRVGGCAMSDKLAGDDPRVFQTLKLGPLASTEAFTAEDVKYIVMLQG